MSGSPLRRGTSHEGRETTRLPASGSNPAAAHVLAALVECGGSISRAAASLGIRPGTVKRHLADLRAKLGLTTEQLIYAERAGGWLLIPSLEPRIPS